MWEYTDKVKEHFLNPKNVGEVENPDGVGDVGSIACGDALHLTFKLDDQGRIAEAKFKTFGCASVIASASALTELIKGKTLEEAGKITNQKIADYLFSRSSPSPQRKRLFTFSPAISAFSVRRYKGHYHDLQRDSHPGTMYRTAGNLQPAASENT